MSEHESYNDTGISIQDALMEIPRNYTPEQNEVIDLIKGPLYSEHLPYEIDDLSPTPLDPKKLMAHGTPYLLGAETYMFDQLSLRIEELDIEIDDYSHDAIAREISMQHQLQVTHNEKALRRIYSIFLRAPESIDMHSAELIYDARIGQSSSLRRMLLLANFPEMEAIEDMKLTSPLNFREILIGQLKYVQNLNSLNSPENGIVVRLLSTKEQNLRRIDVSNTADPGIIALKKTIAEATVGGVELLLKQRESYVLFPTSKDLGEDCVKNIQVINGQRVNMQHVGISAYWTIKEMEEQSPDDEQPSSSLFIPSGTSTIATNTFKRAA